MSIKNINLSCGVKLGDYIYASALHFNGLFKVNVKSGEMEYLGSFLDEKFHIESAHSKAFLIDDDIYYIPSNANNIGVYRLNSNSFDVIHFDKKCGYIGEVVHNILYLLPYQARGDVLKLNRDNNSLEKVISIDDIKPLLDENYIDGYIFLRTAVLDGKIFVPQYRTNRVIIIDTKNDNQLSVISLENHASVFGAFSGQDCLWLLGIDGTVYKWCVENNELYQCSYQQEDGVEKEKLINWIVDIGEYAYAFPGWGTEIYEIKNQQLKPIFNYGIYKKIHKVFNPIVDNNELWILPYSFEKLLHIEKNVCDVISVQSLDDESEIYNKILKEEFDSVQGAPIFENLRMSLEDFVQIVIKG